MYGYISLNNDIKQQTIIVTSATVNIFTTNTGRNKFIPTRKCARYGGRNLISFVVFVNANGAIRQAALVLSLILALCLAVFS